MDIQVRSITVFIKYVTELILFNVPEVLFAFIVLAIASMYKVISKKVSD